MYPLWLTTKAGARKSSEAWLPHSDSLLEIYFLVEDFNKEIIKLGNMNFSKYLTFHRRDLR